MKEKKGKKEEIPKTRSSRQKQAVQKQAVETEIAKAAETAESTLGITAKKEGDFSEWYNQVVLKAGLADYSSVKGFMTIKPNGYAIWENIQKKFDERIKKHGVRNAYFPLLIPESFFEKEAEHAKGFEPEVAWVLRKEEDNEKSERLAIRPTSEAIICDSFSKWVRSHRDLPLKVNQWVNIVRWEIKMTKLFIRTREFLWQEGHCIYETEREAEEETFAFLEEYRDFIEKELAIPVLIGRKTDKEKFAGALYTLTTEAFMPDGRALQLATSHNLGNDFMKVFNVQYLGRDAEKHYPWYISWGMSTRMIGALVMLHSDNKGLVLPPRIAPLQIIIIPILYGDDKKDKAVIEEAEKIRKMLNEFAVDVDLRKEYTAGWKFNEWELKGVPLRIEIGPKDVAEKRVVFVRRNTGKEEGVKIDELKQKTRETLEEMQKEIFEKASEFLKKSIVEVRDFKEFLRAVENKKLIKAFFCGARECEDKIKEKSEGVTSRCISLKEKPPENAKCVYCGNKAKHIVYFARCY